MGLHLDCVSFSARSFIYHGSAMFDHVLDEPFQYGSALADDAELPYDFDKDWGWEYDLDDFIDCDVMPDFIPEDFLIEEELIPYVWFHEDWF